MLQDSKTNVGNGKAYAVCTCDGTESESHDKCAFKTEDLAQAALACDEGYTVKVCTKSSYSCSIRNTAHLLFASVAVLKVKAMTSAS